MFQLVFFLIRLVVGIFSAVGQLLAGLAMLIVGGLESAKGRKKED